MIGTQVLLLGLKLFVVYVHFREHLVVSGWETNGAGGAVVVVVVA